MPNYVRSRFAFQVFVSSFFFASFAFSANIRAATFTVDSYVDAVDATPGDGVCSAVIGINQTACTLRAAVMETNALIGADTIALPPGTYPLSLGAANEDAAKEGDLDILDDLAITGDAASPPVIDGMALDRVFDIRTVNMVVEMRDIKIVNGKVLKSGGGVFNAGMLTLTNVEVSGNIASRSLVYESYPNNGGGGIYNAGALALSNVVLSGNTTDDDGGAIHSTNGTIYLNGALIQGNSAASGRGGGINLLRGDAIILDTKISRNVAQIGGGISSIPSRGSSVGYDHSLYMVGGTIDNNTANSGGGLYFYSLIEVVLNKTLIDGNKASGSGGGLLIDAPARLNQVTVSNNSASSGGGLGVRSISVKPATVDVVDSTFINNTATTSGGGIDYAASGTISNSTVTGNSAGIDGGGIYSGGALKLENVTVSGNTANSTNAAFGRGGGVYLSSGTLDIFNSTIATNASSIPGNNLHNAAGVLKLGNSIIAGSPGNCSGTNSTLGYNIDSGSSCNFPTGTDMSNTDPLLSALADNGGATQTHALQVNSPAIDGVLLNNCPETDQRRFTRSGTTCDIGAFEYNGVAAKAAGTLQIELLDYSVAEGVGNAVLNVTRTGGTEGAISVAWKAFGLTARSGSDYGNSLGIATSGSLTWANGDIAVKTISVPIVNDTIYEPTEKFKVRLFSPTGGAQLGANVEATVSILDDDLKQPGTIQFTPSNSVFENGVDFTITVSRSGGSNGTVTADYATIDGTALAGQDYTAATGTIIFRDGDAISKTFKVSIIDDTVYEGNENFIVNLSNPTGGATIGNSNASTTVTIVDDDPAKPGVFSLSQSNYTVSEGARKITVTVNRSGGADTTVTVPYSTSEGTAISPSDFTTTSGTMSFAPGETTHTFDITIIDDTLVESDETFTVNLDTPFTPFGGATLGTVATATVTITDNDIAAPIPGTFSLDKLGYTVGEGDGKITITINRTSGTSGTVNVPFTVTAGAATQDVDYSGTYSGTITFADGETSHTFDIAITDDAIVEGDEMFVITLGAPTNGGVLGRNSAANATITDNDSVGPTTTPPPTPAPSPTPAKSSGGGGGLLEGVDALALALLLLVRNARRFRKQVDIQAAAYTVNSHITP